MTAQRDARDEARRRSPRIPIAPQTLPRTLPVIRAELWLRPAGRIARELVARIRRERKP
jgi:hypothetical protein